MREIDYEQEAEGRTRKCYPYRAQAVIRALMAAGADPRAQDNEGATPLIKALGCNNPVIGLLKSPGQATAA